MRSLTFLAVLALGACAVTPPKPSIWQIESECADSQPISRIEDCTRTGLDEHYGDAWHSTPAADRFLDFIGVTASRVKTGQMSAADGRLAISTYATQASAMVHAAQEAQQRERQRQLQRILSAMAQDSPGSQGAAAMGRALSGSTTTDTISLFNSSGEPVAYIDTGNGMTIYLWGGQPVAYLDGANVYGFNGHHLGWFSNGAIWDHSGYAACAVRQRLMTVPQIAPIKGVQQITPIKDIEQIAPIEPTLMSAFGNMPCESLLASGTS